MSIDVSEWLPDRRPGPDGGSAETGGESEQDGDGHLEEGRVEVDEQLGELLPEAARLAGPRQASESVRTTFKLSSGAIQLFARLSGRTGKSQKDLLGDALRLSRRALEENPEQVRAAASRYEEVDATTKTMAIAPATRAGLNELAEKAGLPRDHLVEVGIRLVQLSVKEAIRRKIDPHRDILEALKALYPKVEEVQIALTSHPKRSRSDGYEDPVEQALFDILGAISSMARAVEEAAESGTPIEEDRQFL